MDANSLLEIKKFQEKFRYYRYINPEQSDASILRLMAVKYPTARANYTALQALEPGTDVLDVDVVNAKTHYQAQLDADVTNATAEITRVDGEIATLRASIAAENAKIATNQRAIADGKRAKNIIHWGMIGMGLLLFVGLGGFVGIGTLLQGAALVPLAVAGILGYFGVTKFIPGLWKLGTAKGDPAQGLKKYVEAVNNSKAQVATLNSDLATKGTERTTLVGNQTAKDAKRTAENSILSGVNSLSSQELTKDYYVRMFLDECDKRYSAATSVTTTNKMLADEYRKWGTKSILRFYGEAGKGLETPAEARAFMRDRLADIESALNGSLTASVDDYINAKKSSGSTNDAEITPISDIDTELESTYA